MIGIDTNVLIRLLNVDDNAAQSAAATEMVRRTGYVFVSPIVLVEFVWVLESKFGYKRRQIHERLQRLVSAPEFRFHTQEATERAVAHFGNGKPEFADCLLGELNLVFGCRTTMTFDRDAAATAPFSKLTSS